MATFSRPDWLLKIRGTRVVPRGRKPQRVPRVLVRIEYDSSSYRETLPSSWMISQLMMKEGRKGESVERENRGLCVCRGAIFSREKGRVGGTLLVVIGATGPPGSQEFWPRATAICVRPSCVSFVAWTVSKTLAPLEITRNIRVQIDVSHCS